MEEEHKIYSPFLLQHVLMLVDFPKEIGRLRLVSKTWNEAALKGLGAQIMRYDMEIEKLKKQLAVFDEAPHYSKLIEEYKVFQKKKKVVIKAKYLKEVFMMKMLPAAVQEGLNLVSLVLFRKLE